LLGFIGCGVMGSTIIKGILSRKFVVPENISVFDKDGEKTKELEAAHKVKRAPDLLSLCNEANLIFLAVKPHEMESLLIKLKPFIQEKHTLISVAAGLTISFFEKNLGKSRKLIRVMPNTPSLVGEGMSVVSKGSQVTDEEEKQVINLFEALGKVLPLEEKYIDAATGLSGSGPAYTFMFIEALADGGVEMGLDRETALLLASQTVFGAAQMMIESGEHPAVLKNKVTSPGGTTSAGLIALEEGGLRNAAICAVKEAAERSKLLGK